TFPSDAEQGNNSSASNSQLDAETVKIDDRNATDAEIKRLSKLSPVEQVFDSVEVEKERVAAAAGEKSVVARLDDIRIGAEGDLVVSDYRRPWRSVRARLRARRHEYVSGLPAVLRLREHIAECDVR